MLVLVGDAEQEYGEVIGELLRCQSHRVVLAASLDSFQRFLERSSADLIVMSTSLLRDAPQHAIRRIRTEQSTPIILTFEHEGPAVISACFDAGADDCIRKPFHPSEFAARVDAVARRYSRQNPAYRADAVDRIPESGIHLDHINGRVYGNGVDVHCSQLEYQILRAMLEAGGQVLSYAALNERVWGYSSLHDGTLIKGHVSSIRSKLRAAGCDPDIIRTVYGVGYGLTTDAQADIEPAVLSA